MKEKQGRFIEWKDGLPYVNEGRTFTRQSLTSMVAVAMSLPYEPLRDTDVNSPYYGDPLPGEDRFEGMTKGEVAAIRQADAAAWGNQHAAEFMFDRIMGKPKQQVETLNVSVSYKDFLDQIASTEDQKQSHELQIDVRVRELPAISEQNSVDHGALDTVRQLLDEL